jgi:single-strand DNA-binding protein
MTDINSVVLVGRITKDVGSDERSFSYVGNGTAKAVVNIAVNRGVKKGDKWEDEVSFFDVVIWGKTAENLKPRLTKGTQITVSGYLKQDRWEKDGQKQSRVQVVADMVEIPNVSKKEADKVAEAFGGEAFPEDNPFGN